MVNEEAKKEPKIADWLKGLIDGGDDTIGLEELYLSTFGFPTRGHAFSALNVYGLLANGTQVECIGVGGFVGKKNYTLYLEMCFNLSYEDALDLNNYANVKFYKDEKKVKKIIEERLGKETIEKYVH